MLLRPLVSLVACGFLLACPLPATASSATDGATADTPPPHERATMPVLMWGAMPAEDARKIGFSTIEGNVRRLEEIQTHGLDAILRNTKSETINTRYAAVDRNGTPYHPGRRGAAAGLLPEVQAHVYQRALNLARTVGDHPAWRYLLLHPERRGNSEISFDPVTRQAFEDHAGYPIPDTVVSHRGLDYRELPAFPENRILPEEHPLFRFYQWYWQGGDGWAAIHDAAVRGVRDGGREDLVSLAAPALRIPSVYDSWGEVTALLHWTYAHPDPTRLAHTTDALLTMAAGSHPPKKTFAMTQLFTKRHYVMPRDRKDTPLWDAQNAPFTDVDPDAAYLTITPDQLAIAFWSSLARPIDGIAFHGWQSIVASDGTHAYKLTHLQTQHTLQALIRDVVEPLGPTLLKLQDPPARVGFLQSFASEMFAGRGTYGWPFLSWQGDAYLALLHTGLQPRILFDQTIRQGGLEGLDVLVLVHCDVLTDRVAAAIADFQQRGGRVVADEHLAPGVTADVLWETEAVAANAARRKQTILAKAQELEEKLGRSLPRQIASSHRDVLVRRRQGGAADYLFAVNDQRQAGTYLGQHGWVMEEGVATATELSIQRPEGVVYDLVRRQAVPGVRASNGWLRFDHVFGPGEGSVFLIAPTPIERLELVAPETLAPGERGTIHIRVLDPQGQPVAATVPLQVQLRDSAGQTAVIGTYHAAEQGELRIAWTPTSESSQGPWKLFVTELASGQTARALIQVMH